MRSKSSAFWIFACSCSMESKRCACSLHNCSELFASSGISRAAMVSNKLLDKGLIRNAFAHSEIFEATWGIIMKGGKNFRKELGSHKETRDGCVS